MQHSFECGQGEIMLNFFLIKASLVKEINLLERGKAGSTTKIIDFSVA
jgi:hypothetical protein